MDPIAIIGLAFRLPGGIEDVSSLWDMLKHGRNLMREWPENRANIGTFYRPDSGLKNTLYSKGGYFMDGDPAAFDAPFFSITPQEAAAMDPQQRWLLETSYRALENGTKTAVYASFTSEDYIMMTAKDPDHAPHMVSTSTSPSIQANRLSCMVTMDLACQSLRNGQSSMALIASGNSLLSPEWSLYMSNMNFLSKDSRCYSFDHRANGYARGEGVIVLVLKRLADAIRDGDTIRAVVRGTGSNQDGRTPALPRPSQSAQEALIRQVYESCNLSFETTRYVETHGTGTQIGDVTEATALGRVFRGSRSTKEPLYIGSIKANIGHLEGGSGLASILKTIMILENGVIPPNALFEKLNSKINAKFYHLEVPTSCVPWPSHGLRRISIDSFGFGGANSHIILDDAFHTLEALGTVGCHHTLTSPSFLRNAPEKVMNGEVDHTSDRTNKVTPEYRLLTWSARDEDALKQMLHLYDAYVKSHLYGDANFVGQLAYTLAARRTVMTWRSFSVLNGQESPETFNLAATKCERAARDVGVAFIFTGQGAQYANMGMELIRYPIVQATLAEADIAFRELGAEWSLFALVELLGSFNIFPDVVVGHSSGEITAAYTIGALSLRSACRISYHRGRLAGKVATASALQPGAMMSVNLAELEAESYVEKASLIGRVSIACINSPTNVTLSGDETTIDRLQVDLEKDGIFTRKLRTGVAYHSPAMHQIAEEYMSSLGSLEKRQSHAGEPLMVSTVTSQKVAAISLLEPQYWVDNLESPVRFVDALRYVVHTAPKVDGLKPITNYLEIGPHGALQRPIRDTLSSAGNSIARYMSILAKQTSPSKTVLQLVGQLFACGHPVSIISANQQDSPPSTAKAIVDSPQYPFNKMLTYWHEPRTSRDWRLREGPLRSLLGLRTSDWNPLQPRWRKILTVEDVPWVADHIVGNTIIFPAVGSITIAMEAVRQTASGSQAIRGYHVKEATFTSPIIITPGQTTEVVTHLHPLQQAYERSLTRFEIEIFSYAENYWRVCCKCIIHVEFEQESRTEVDGGQELQLLTDSLAGKYESIQLKADVKIASSDFYNWLHENSFRYGPTFSLADEVCWNGNEFAIAQINVGPPVEEFEECVVHPGILDSCLQICPIPPSQGMSLNIPTSIPHKIKDAWISETGWQSPSTGRVKVIADAKLKHAAAGLDCEVAVLSETGALLFYIKRLEMLPIMARERGDDDTERTLLHYIDWKPQVGLNKLQQSREVSNALANSPSSEGAAVHDRTELEETLKFVVQQNMDNLRGTDLEKMSVHIRQYINLLESQLQEKPTRDVPKACGIAAKLQDIGARRPSWKIFTEVAHNLNSIINEESHGLELSLSSPLVQDYLDDMVATVCNPNLEAYFELLAHQKPTQGSSRIEARTGGIAFAEYTYSDASPTSVDDARQRFAEHKERIEFKCLDFKQDLLTQGIRPASYDVILAAGSLQGAKDIGAVLRNFRQVLTPGGQLVLQEITTPNRFEIALGFGAIKDWWSDQLDDCYSDRTITPIQWDAALTENGFSGIDLIIRDYQNDAAHCSSAMASTAAAQPSLPLAYARVILVIDEDEFQKSLAGSLLQNTSWNSRVLTVNEMADVKLESSDHVICLADVYSPFLHPMRQTTLNSVKNWVQESTNLFWVTACDAESTALSSSYPYAGVKDGFLRTLRSEFPLNRIVSLTVDGGARDVLTFAKYVLSVFGSAFNRGSGTDVEYIVRDGQILTGRLVDDTQTTNDLMSSIRPKNITEPWLPGPPLTLAVRTRGQLETLYFREDPEYYHELGPTDVEIEAKVWGVGFRDVFLALGRLDEDDFGADCAGVVTRIGAEVQSVRVGDRVYSVSFEEACAVVIPGMTALQSLIEVARLHKGEKVLIHSASGGTGQLALQIAQMVGAEIFATVGYDHKKQLLIEDFAKNALFAGIDLHHIVKDVNRKELAHKLLQKTMDLAKDGHIRAPKPLHVYDVDSVEGAFRYLASGKNTGRIVIRVDSSTIVQV
ncbi:hypothetical protein ONZ43_g5443 [Nemania bipapillata]|uniref:Uncharacterized protein n=1 Tax=Nemania bipapillata TaxID=110536 RepID=A0ACC2IAN4_9PEZI|nr:hypothetical protein ONZ43_g5443 [Nemania bipapillata]